MLKNKLLSLTLGLLMLVSVACQPVAPNPTPPNTPPALPQAQPVLPIDSLPADDGWWQNAVFYQIFVRSFNDSDGDGVGDFNGITAKLDYLHDLGVRGIWLMPIHPTTTYHGYDVKDYFSVNPEYGTLDDLKRLVQEAHARDIRLIIDWVINHSSSAHPWFEAAKDRTSPFRNWYVWSDAVPTGAGWHGSVNGYYYGHFDSIMPDLNYANPEVTAKMHEATQFWLTEVGIDGFRIDAAKFLLEEGSIKQNAASTLAWFQEYRRFYKGVNPLAMTVGEVWDSSPLVAKYVQDDRLDLVFNFDLAKEMVTAARAGRADTIGKRLVIELGIFPTGTVATFLTNHDQPRVASMLADRPHKMKLAAAMLFTTPGVPFIYYGEEIGMLGKKPDPDIRVPMQWTGDPTGGFTTGTPWRALNPDVTIKNVAAQQADPDSVWHYYRTLIALRNNHVALRTGELVMLESGNASVLAFLRVAPQETALVVINLSDDPVSDYALKLESSSLSGRLTPVSLLEPGLTAAPLAFAEAGALAGYQPVTELAGARAYIYQLQPVP